MLRIYLPKVEKYFNSFRSKTMLTFRLLLQHCQIQHAFFRPPFDSTFRHVHVNWLPETASALVLSLSLSLGQLCSSRPAVKKDSKMSRIGLIGLDFLRYKPDRHVDVKKVLCLESAGLVSCYQKNRG